MTLEDLMISKLRIFLDKKNVFDEVDAQLQKIHCATLKDSYYLQNNICYNFFDSFASEFSRSWKNIYTRTINNINESFDPGKRVAYPEDLLLLREYRSARGVVGVSCYGPQITNYWNVQVVIPEEEKFLKYTLGFFRAIQGLPNPVKDIFYRPYDTLPVNYLDVTDKGEVTYLASEKISRVKDKNYYDNNYRVKTSIGKIIVKLLGDIYKSNVIETITHKFKSSWYLGELQCWEGEDIKKAYLESNYTRIQAGSSLHQSCMRYSKCQSYFDFYIKLGAKIIVILDENNKIKARALLWDTDKGLFLDRVYSTSDENICKTIQQVKRQLPIQYYKYNHTIFNRADSMECPEMKVNTLLKNYKGTFPYCDTMYYYQPETGIVSNYNHTYKLQTTTGGFY